jgi:hypothetical protein
MPKSAHGPNRTRRRDLLLAIVLITIGLAALIFANSHRDFPAFTGVLIGISGLSFGTFLLLDCTGRYLGLARDRMTPEQEHRVIKNYIDDLLQSIGGAIPDVEPRVLKTLFKQKNYPAMLGWIKNAMRLELKVGLRIVDKIEGEHPMSIEWSKPIPHIGTKEFKNYRVVVNARRDIVDTKPFEWIVAGFAHELSHVVLFSMGHKLQEEEKAVDLTSMILGFGDFLVGAKQSTSETTSRIGYSVTSTKTDWLGYLTIPERDFARKYLKKIRRERQSSRFSRLWC